MAEEKTRIAVILFNLGGPDQPESIEPFLFNLFNDPAIIGAPNPIRWLLAKMISRRRAPVAAEIYEHLGGKSPLLELTRDQAQSLERELRDQGEVRCFVCMRYWHPMSEEVAHEVEIFSPDRIVLLPLYPQYSTTTSESSIKDWRRAAKKAGLDVDTRTICCYPTEPGFVEAVSELVGAAYAEASKTGAPRILFSAHGLPKKVIARGDPYQWQVEQTAAAVMARLGDGFASADWSVCYQSRVGPLEWIGPATEDELTRAGADKVPVVLVPIAFVSEHSETLVELDIEYREEAHRLGVPAYHRVPAVGVRAAFIDGLAGLVRAALGREATLSDGCGGRTCEARFGKCAQGGRL
ncbi:MAG: ferrochelatase [Rhodospirillales bacterium]|nr:ferrochelatase [Rhodospirillales bacterium]